MFVLQKGRRVYRIVTSSCLALALSQNVVISNDLSLPTAFSTMFGGGNFICQTAIPCRDDNERVMLERAGAPRSLDSST